MGITYCETLNGEILGEISGSQRLDYLPDALGSVVTTTNQANVVQHTARYTPFGSDLALTGSRPSFGWVGTLGYRETGLRKSEHYVRSRHYCVSTGRWRSMDPLWPTESSFNYVQANPITWQDPSGMQRKRPRCEDPFGSFFGQNLQALNRLLPANQQLNTHLLRTSIEHNSCCMELLRRKGSGAKEVNAAMDYLLRTMWCSICLETNFEPQQCIGGHTDAINAGQSDLAYGIGGFRRDFSAEYGGGETPQEIVRSMRRQVDVLIGAFCHLSCELNNGCDCSGRYHKVRGEWVRYEHRRTRDVPRNTPWPANIWPYYPGAKRTANNIIEMNNFRACMKKGGFASQVPPWATRRLTSAK